MIRILSNLSGNFYWLYYCLGNFFKCSNEKLKRLKIWSVLEDEISSVFPLIQILPGIHSAYKTHF